ncbi:hypothetical protein GCM10011452_29660 [Gemmobacter lanyuensis]|uniref:Uncharacterized protein n=1 Tax=Gemmobacter lanyuensis TaxID=1054497 RepID=A0A918MNG7_9RHOB|nr:hypothetical protein [Gemmobacter lanyuensis]GGW39455.1 hypothetical protein GCM10011452_29660 [Gemmobacter lanyuensis]
MAQFSVKIMRLTGSVLGENQHSGVSDGAETIQPGSGGNIGKVSKGSVRGFPMLVAYIVTALSTR